MTDKLRKAIEVLKYLSESIKIGGGKSLIYTRDAEAIDTVVSEVEKPIYTADDMEAFLLWASDNGWFYGKLTEMWHNYAEIDINADYDTSKRYSIDDLVKIWEQQRKEATE
jgi:hypothetical protein